MGENYTFITIQRKMEAMEGAARNDPNRSILDINMRPKGEAAPECYCGMNAGYAVSFDGETYGRLYWCCQRIHEITKRKDASEGSRRTSAPDVRSFGPDCYDTPLECFPLEHRLEFINGKELRPYDNRIDVWPKCNHNKICVVQVYDGFQDGGHRFFRCHIGEAYFDERNCRYARWVDPRNFYHIDEYINYLKCKIDDLQRKVDCLNSQLKEATPYPCTVSLIEDPLCPDVWCKCPYHMKKNQPPPPPTSSGGGVGPSPFSGGGGEPSQNSAGGAWYD
ncbi:hypothetical protein HU200_056074 [Digitaria exilis]|uniref:GRF-type domain-containing protein n=1 Tax=Digitaria exilis TaxID=1010633 RepID=A0A835AFY9_9POAL|nr:hypothetical protein HU200_056074 [Digitaria exilis]